MLGLFFFIDLSGSLLPVMSASFDTERLGHWKPFTDIYMYTVIPGNMTNGVSEFMERGAPCKSDYCIANTTITSTKSPKTQTVPMETRLCCCS